MDQVNSMMDIVDTVNTVQVAVENAAGDTKVVDYTNNVRPINPRFVMLLDESGSMSDNRNSILDAVNSLINDQKKLSHTLNDDATLTIIKFANEGRTLIKNESFKTINNLSLEQYNPDGGTALYDAIGMGINQHEDEKNVVMVIVTDGEENCSKHHTHSNIMMKIETKKEMGWNFIYLANDLSVSQRGASLGFDVAAPTETTSACNNISVGYNCMGPALERCVSHAITNYRQTSAVPNMNYATELSLSPPSAVQSSTFGNLPLAMPVLTRIQSLPADFTISNPQF